MKDDSQIKVYLSYSHKDEIYIENFRSHLMSLNDKYDLRILSDVDKIQFGANIHDYVSDKILEADVVFAFVSPDYFSSEFCQKELEEAIKESDKGQKTLIPILLRESYWQGTNIAHYQVLPRNIKPIQSIRNRDLAFKEIVSELDTVFRSITKEKEEKNKTRFQITLNLAESEFNEDDQKKLLDAISKIIGLEETKLKIVNKKKGSIKLTIEGDENLDEDKIRVLLASFERVELRSFNLSKIEAAQEIESNDERRPRVFIGSSSEGLELAEAIQLNLDHTCEVTIWSQGVFGLGMGTLETLVQQLNNFDFAPLSEVFCKETSEKQ